ncbi:MAG: hypothetical protein KGZ79_05660 [Dethiobacter sp.]|jgi:hypothetical protein|nr:hypothetical protein [Dethiobacter sp.]
MTLALQGLARSLNRFNSYASIAAKFVDGVHYNFESNLFSIAADTIILGTVHRGNHIAPFGLESQLSESEKVYLLGIREHLEYLHSQLYSNETRQENPNLPRESFNKIVFYTRNMTVNEHSNLLDEYLGKPEY